MASMKLNDTCSGCGQKQTCRGAYEKIGKSEAPNVAWKAVVAFVLPIIVFIGALAGAQRLLAGRLEDRLLTLVSFLLALFVTLVFLCVVRAIQGPVNKDVCDKGS